ncbi:Hsp70 family protein [Desulfobacula phenolica]|uniref:Molecular chaperone DnaK (HSP70) n=1 Tax=Desulfobacula phenolica TaxID=90732 RepID=A0A1H2HDB3_9BACT|nr:Hsp70 family protein [Desulfobacula phenolica]SDU29850.1 Molecular chaperone DnaK (HSP70) [Desulfobacula phenolica]
MAEQTYIIGIDLGTTNSIVSYTKINPAEGEENTIKVFNIPQLVDAGVVVEREMLPSFIFMPEKHDVSDGALETGFGTGNAITVGEFARNRGAEIPQRMISSAKSWLCNTLIDRNKPVLPWKGPGDISKMSPVEASSAILSHIRDAWNHVMAKDNKDFIIENQDVYLTVPASFDAVARELTANAATMTGFENITLLEEPQAAFYSWIEALDDKWRKVVKKDDTVLVCDIGGGTTDFSLIRISEEEGDLVLERVAVGDHLLVGGDNMDLALAYFVSQKLAEKGKKLDVWQMQGLSHSCRNAKEKMLQNPEMDKFPVTVLGRGSGLIGGTIKIDLAKTDVENILVDGFFPQCDSNAMPVARQKSGIRELGLSYEADPAITKHMAKFLSRQKSNGEKMEIPNAVLFNGGIMKADPVRKRILDTLFSWRKEAGLDSPEVREIASENFDLSVARGAAYYGRARRGDGIRIRGGLGRSYYMSIAAAMPAIPGLPAPVKALCLAPYGMEEGTEAHVEDQEFVIVVGEEVSFDIMESTCRHEDVVGTVVEEWEQGEIENMSTIETVLEGEYGSVIPVTIEIKVTEIGTLEFWCVSREDGQRWKLEFNVRERDDFES